MKEWTGSDTSSDAKFFTLDLPVSEIKEPVKLVLNGAAGDKGQEEPDDSER